MILPHPERQPEGARVKGKPFYPMQVLNDLVMRKLDRQAPSCDWDETPIMFRRYVGTGVQDVQLWNGLRSRIASGLITQYRGSGYLDVVMPRIPGQTRGNYGGFVPRGPSPYNYADAFMAGPGSQPAHPGGPAKIAAPQYYNPGTG